MSCARIHFLDTNSFLPRSVSRKVLIVSPYFPPANTPDLHRVRMSVRHYRENGWEPVILAVRTSSSDTMVEPELAATLPPDLRVTFVHPVPAGISRFLGVGNIGWRGLAALAWRGFCMLRKEKFDVVFFSTSQFAVFPLGRVWQALCHVPYVLDFQDAWLTDYYVGARRANAPGGAKFRWANLHAEWLEGWSVREASGLISVSSSLLEKLVRRYSMERVPHRVIPFGASAHDKKVASRLTVNSGRELPFSKIDTLHAVSTGAVGPIMSQALQCLFAGFALARNRASATLANWKFHFLGTSYAGPGRGTYSVRPSAEAQGLADCVEEKPDRIGHLEALRWQQQADLLILLGSGDATYAPSKLYPYLLNGRPILALVLRDSELDKRMADLESAHVVPFSAETVTADEIAAVADFFTTFSLSLLARANPGESESLLPPGLSSQELTAQQCEIFGAARLSFAHSFLP